MTPNQKTMLQASRGLAAFFVALFHISAMSDKYFHYNFLGVAHIGRSGGLDYFFVLTGFLMMFLYGGKFGTGTAVYPFLLKRLVRIYPFYWLITLVVLPVYVLVPTFGFGYETKKDTIINSLLLLPQSHGPILPVAWSLSYFVLFYLVVALVIRLRKQWAFSIGAVWIAISLLNALHVPIISSDIHRHLYLNFLFDEPALEFGVGAAITVLVRKFRFKHRFPLVATALLLFLFIWLNNAFGVAPYHGNLVYILPAAALLLGIMAESSDKPLPQWLLAFSRLGDASFSVLLTHLLIISVCMKILKATHAANHIGYLGDVIFVMVCTFPMCVLAHEWLEKPLTTGLRSLLVKKLSGAH